MSWPWQYGLYWLYKSDLFCWLWLFWISPPPCQLPWTLALEQHRNWSIGVWNCYSHFGHRQSLVHQSWEIQHLGMIPRIRSMIPGVAHSEVTIIYPICWHYLTFRFHKMTPIGPTPKASKSTTPTIHRGSNISNLKALSASKIYIYRLFQSKLVFRLNKKSSNPSLHTDQPKALPCCLQTAYLRSECLARSSWRLSCDLFLMRCKKNTARFFRHISFKCLKHASRDIVSAKGKGKTSTF